MNSALLRLIAVLIMAVVIAACAPAATVMPSKRFFWPPEPDEPRVEWIASYTGDLDIKAKDLFSFIVGEDSNVLFGRPISVASNGEGIFVVSDQALAQVFWFDLNRRQVYPLGGKVESTDFKQPSGVAVDKAGNFYVADTSYRKIFVVNAQNSIVSVIDLSSLVKSIGALTVDTLSNLLVVPDAKGGKILYLTFAGELIRTINGKGYFSYPNSVAVSTDGTLYIADSFNASILRFSADGKYLNSIGKRGDSPGDLTLVTGLAVDSEDHVYATDGRLHSVTIFDKDGNALLVIGGHHSVASGNIGRGGFQIPQGISIDKNDRIYVADSFNRRVQVLQYLNRRYLEKNPIVKDVR